MYISIVLYAMAVVNGGWTFCNVWKIVCFVPKSSANVTRRITNRPVMRFFSRSSLTNSRHLCVPLFVLFIVDLCTENKNQKRIVLHNSVLDLGVIYLYKSVPFYVILTMIVYQIVPKGNTSTASNLTGLSVLNSSISGTSAPQLDE